MGFKELIKKRETTYEFSDKNISSASLNVILKAGILSPSFLNLQPWKFLVIRDKGMISKLMESAVYGGFHNDPPVLILPILLGKLCYRKNSEVSKREGGIIGGIKSLSMASMNMVLQGTDLGIQTAVITPKKGEIRKILKIPLTDRVPLILAFGYAKKGAFRKFQKRKSFKDVVVYESLKRS